MLKLAGPEVCIRPATKDDVDAMADVFFRSFNAPFWQVCVSRWLYVEQP
jgi:hypothetical protein